MATSIQSLVQLVLSADPRQLIAGINRAEVQTARSLTRMTRDTQAGTRSMGGALRLLRAEYLKVTAAIGVVTIAAAGAVRAYNTWTAAANQQIVAERKLEQILKALSGATDDQVQSLKDQASALQNVTQFGDEVTIQAQAILASYALTSEEVQVLTPRLLDLASATDLTGQGIGDLTSQANALGKALASGNSGALRRYGLALSDTQAEAFKLASAQERVVLLANILDQNFQGLAASIGQTYAGEVQRLRNNAGDLNEVLGFQITNNADVIESVQSLARVYVDLQGEIAGASGEIRAVVSALAGSVRVVVGTVRFFYNSIQLVFKSAVGVTAQVGAAIVQIADLALRGLKQLIPPLRLIDTDLSGIAVSLQDTSARMEEGIIQDSRDARAALAEVLGGLSDVFSLGANREVGQGLGEVGRVAEEALAKILVLENQRKEAAQEVADAQKKLAIEVAQEQEKAQVQAIRNQIDSQQELLREQRKRVDEAIREEKRYTDEAKRLRLDLAQSERTIEQQIADLRRRGLSEERQQSSLRQEIAQQQREASAAIATLREAETQDAREAAAAEAQAATQRAQALAGQLTDARSAEQALKQVGQTRAQLLEEQIRQAEASAQAQRDEQSVAKNAATETEKNLERLKALADRLEQTDPTVEVRAEIDEARDKLIEIEKKLRDLRAGADVPVTVTSERDGLGFARGGFVPGSGSGDTVPAWLTPGEYVIRRAAVRALGLPLLDRMNQSVNGPSVGADGAQRFADGGPVGAGTDMGSITITLPGGSPRRVSGPRDTLDALRRDAEALARGLA